MVVDPITYTSVTRFVYADEDILQEEALDKLNQGGYVFISEVIREKYKVFVGDEITLKTPKGRAKFEVAAY